MITVGLVVAVVVGVLVGVVGRRHKGRASDPLPQAVVVESPGLPRRRVPGYLRGHGGSM